MQSTRTKRQKTIVIYEYSDGDCDFNDQSPHQSKREEADKSYEQTPYHIDEEEVQVRTNKRASGRHQSSSIGNPKIGQAKNISRANHVQYPIVPAPQPKHLEMMQAFPDCPKLQKAVFKAHLKRELQMIKNNQAHISINFALWQDIKKIK